MSLKTSFIITTALLVLGSFAFVCGVLADGPSWFLVAGFLVMTAALLGYLFYYRCPHCGSHLTRIRFWRDDFCPRCGERIDWTEKQSRRR